MDALVDGQAGWSSEANIGLAEQTHVDTRSCGPEWAANVIYPFRPGRADGGSQTLFALLIKPQPCRQIEISCSI